MKVYAPKEQNGIFFPKYYSKESIVREMQLKQLFDKVDWDVSCVQKSPEHYRNLKISIIKETVKQSFDYNDTVLRHTFTCQVYFEWLARGTTNDWRYSRKTYSNCYHEIFVQDEKEEENERRYYNKDFTRIILENEEIDAHEWNALTLLKKLVE